jgi:hypothetical protein
MELICDNCGYEMHLHCEDIRDEYESTGDGTYMLEYTDECTECREGFSIVCDTLIAHGQIVDNGCKCKFNGVSPLPDSDTKCCKEIINREE